MVDGGWWGLGGGTILMRMRGLCATGFFMQFSIFELGVFGGPSWMVDGRRETRGFWEGAILFRMRGFCVVGFFMQFLIFDRGAQEL